MNVSSVQVKAKFSVQSFVTSASPWRCVCCVPKTGSVCTADRKCVYSSRCGPQCSRRSTGRRSAELRLSDAERCRAEASEQESQRESGGQRILRPPAPAEEPLTPPLYTSEAVFAGTAVWTHRPGSDSEPPASDSLLPPAGWSTTPSDDPPPSRSAATPRCDLPAERSEP